MPLDTAAAGALQGKTVVLAVRSTPDFALMKAASKGTAAAVLLGPIGGAIAAASAISAGNELVRTNHIADPAVASGQAILAALIAKYQFIVHDPGDTQVHGQEPEKIVMAYPGVDLVLDVETTNWAANWFPDDWSHYGIFYRANLRLIDARTVKVIAEATCSRKPDKQPDSPTYDQLIQDGATRLKSMSNGAGDACREELRSKLSLSSPP